MSEAAAEDVGATASRIERWLLVEYGGLWPYDPLDAAPFADGLRARLAAQLRTLRPARLLLVKPGTRHDRIRVVYGSTPERAPRFRRLDLDSYADLYDLDLEAAFAADDPPGVPLEHPLLLVCTHGKRDRCCARYGQRACRALARAAPPDWTWQASHVGGDRFAGNVVAFPEGVYFGRVGSRDVPRVVAAYRAGRLALDRYRGRSCHPFPVQAAELAVRRATGLDGLWDLRVITARRAEADLWRVEVLAELAGDVHQLELRAELGPPEYLTCRATEPRRPRRWVVRRHRIVQAESARSNGR